MSVLRRPGPRFVLWAILLVGVAAATGVAGLSSWLIGGLVFGAWVIVVLCERRLSGAWSTGSPAAVRRRATAVDARLPRLEPARESVALEPELSSVVKVTRAVPVDPPPVAAPAPRRRAVSRKPPPPAPPSETQWNVWTLEEVVRENAPDNDELVYLTVSLRDFADANGLLPVGFDPLVRESFGPLLALAT